MYVPLSGFTTRLTSNLGDKDRHLPIPEKDYDFLLAGLKDGDYSFLEIRDGNAIEYVKLVNICDKMVITRGAEKTSITSFRCGTGVSFIMTMQGVKDTICQMEDCHDL